MDNKIAFQQYDDFVTPIDVTTDLFVPEQSLSVKEILSQFAFVDNIRLADLMRQGYMMDDDDSDFDLPDFDSLDIAEKQEYYEHSKDFIAKYEAEQALLKQKKEETKENETDQ